MKKCVLMFFLLVVALLTAVLLERKGDGITEDNFVAGNQDVENTLIAQKK